MQNRKNKIALRHLFAFAIPFISAGLTLSGCGGGGTTTVPTPQPTTQPTNGPTPQPTTQPLTPGGKGPGYTLSSQTYLFTTNSPVQITSQNPTSLTLNKAVKLAPGSIILSQVGNGTLVKVTTSTISGNSTVVQTQAAALSEAFTQLTLPSQVPWNEAVAGPITSTNPGVTAKWANDVIRLNINIADTGAPTTSTAASGKAQAAAVVNGIGVTGSVDFKANPVLNPVVVTGPDGKGVLKSLEIGFKPEFHGSLQLQRKTSGSFSLNTTFVDQMLKPFPVGPLIVRPRLTVSASVSGKASYAYAGGIKCDANATALLNFTNNTIQPVLQGASNTSPDITLAKGAFDYDARAINANVTFEIMGIGGPNIGAFVGSKGKGSVVVKADGKNVISADAGAGLYMQVGLKGSAFLQKLFEEFFGAGKLPNVGKDFQLLGPNKHWEFPIQSSAILVGDNGSAADDVFEVTVDGVALGATQKGKDGRFPINDLAPGEHTLNIRCTDDGQAGADVGTLGVTLNDGLKFRDGSTTFSADVSLGASVNLVFVVPTEPATSKTVASIQRVTTGRKGR